MIAFDETAALFGSTLVICLTGDSIFACGIIGSYFSCSSGMEGISYFIAASFKWLKLSYSEGLGDGLGEASSISASGITSSAVAFYGLIEILV